MNIITKYNLQDIVTIKEIKQAGRIVSIWITSTGLQYEIKYFQEGKIQKEYFYEDEIE